MEFKDLNYPDISESEKDEVESPKKMPTKFHNPFIQNIVANVNKAFDYKPGEQNKPIYNFNPIFTKKEAATP